MNTSDLHASSHFWSATSNLKWTAICIQNEEFRAKLTQILVQRRDSASREIGLSPNCDGRRLSQRRGSWYRHTPFWFAHTALNLIIRMAPMLTCALNYISIEKNESSSI